MTDLGNLPARTEGEINALGRDLDRLTGATITGFAAAVDGALDVWPTLYVTTATGVTLTITVSRDPEGNGPGHLFIEPRTP